MQSTSAATTADDDDDEGGGGGVLPLDFARFEPVVIVEAAGVLDGVAVSQRV